MDKKECNSVVTQSLISLFCNFIETCDDETIKVIHDRLNSLDGIKFEYNDKRKDRLFNLYWDSVIFDEKEARSLLNVLSNTGVSSMAGLYLNDKRRFNQLTNTSILDDDKKFKRFFYLINEHRIKNISKIAESEDETIEYLKQSIEFQKEHSSNYLYILSESSFMLAPYDEKELIFLEKDLSNHDSYLSTKYVRINVYSRKEEAFLDDNFGYTLMIHYDLKKGRSIRASIECNEKECDSLPPEFVLKYNIILNENSLEKDKWEAYKYLLKTIIEHSPPYDKTWTCNLCGKAYIKAEGYINGSKKETCKDCLEKIDIISDHPDFPQNDSLLKELLKGGYRYFEKNIQPKLDKYCSRYKTKEKDKLIEWAKSLNPKKKNRQKSL